MLDGWMDGKGLPYKCHLIRSLKVSDVKCPSDIYLFRNFLALNYFGYGKHRKKQIASILIYNLFSSKHFFYSESYKLNYSSSLFRLFS